MHLKLEKHTLSFIKPAKTSRGEYLEKPSYLLWIVSDQFKFCGEAAPLSDLSVDGNVDYFDIIEPFKNQHFNHNGLTELLELWEPFPALRFALFCAIKKVKFFENNGHRHSMMNENLWVDNDFTKGIKPMKINGLVWMNSIEAMYEEAIQKINNGFTCIKFKVGALDFDAECRLLEKIRQNHNPFKVEIRLDANGGFANDEALSQLKELNRFNIHSIEQPIKANQPELMHEMCAKSPIDIALDEELIGISVSESEKLLNTIKPKYIILKPTLLGGFDICDRWIQAADKLNIGWWSTSALEGNIGLSDIAQWVSNYLPSLPQGLGTGSLFVQNFEAQTHLKGENIYFNTHK